MTIPGRRIVWLLAVASCVAFPVRAEIPDLVAPRAMAALEQGLAAETAAGSRSNPELAISLYCDVGVMGASEGFYRVGRMLASGPAFMRNPALANAYFALAARLGHHAADEAFDARIESVTLDQVCVDLFVSPPPQRFDLDAYVARLAPERRRIADLIRRYAERFGVDTRLAMAVAMAESNLDARAVSPKNAQGVMQLIPGTQERFGVRDAFDAESNVRGGVAYLKWLKGKFDGDWALVAAAYNAGEGVVERHKGIPPYAETQGYVRRVLFFAGLGSLAGF